MPSLHEFKRRSIIPLIGLGLGAYLVLVFLPLERRAESFDAPLDRAWQKLATSLEVGKTNAIDFVHITNQLSETRQELAILQQARQKTVGLLEIPRPLAEQMSAPFQLFEYENARGREMEDLARLAKQNKVVLDPGVFAGFPEHTADVRQPELLWASLAMIDSLLRTAIHCQVTAIHSLQSPVVLTNAPGSAGGRWAEIPIQAEFSASSGTAIRFLHLLPLRPEEAASAGHAAISTNKPPLFIDRLVMRKQSPEKPDEVRVLVRATGFVPQEF